MKSINHEEADRCGGKGRLSFSIISFEGLDNFVLSL